MAVVDQLADELAKTVLEAMDRLDDDRFFEKVSRVVGSTSPTLEEAFLTSIRIRLADKRARAFVAKALEAAKTGGEAPKAPSAPPTDSH
ncbi:MAG: hypothetical protein P8O10_02455 [Pseudorhodobacter sp.]|jgi:hypothetical protein|nr:hypothetical protein [Pseudorhodobacter sp.]